MKTKLYLILAALFAISACVGITQAQEEKQEQKKTTHKNVRTVKGCLAKGEGDEYSLTGTDGSTWEVKSDAVKLAPHVGHTVTATGVVSNAAAHGAKEDAKNEAKEHGIAKGSTEHGTMTVTNIKMDSDSCK
jgi:hypothetical protein